MRIWIGCFIVIAIMALSVPLEAGAKDVSVAPPPAPVYEVDVGERPGYILSPGYWRWNGKKHIWVASRWVKERKGFDWVQDQWEQRGEKWRFVPGHWEKNEDFEDVTLEDEPHVIQTTLGHAPEPVIETETETIEIEPAAVEEKPVVTTKLTKANAKKAKAVKHQPRAKKIDYSDPKKYPRYRRP